ncbi:ABC transporter permease [Salinigranum sp. GCM10025319]|uniref:ABC transporter permease n=1 Tax=Salinigranum sp. GCM10025319 TaxID=3252687 RepID=UPI003621A07E
MSRLRGTVGLAFTQLRRDRTRTVLVIVGIALAVLASTMLATVGLGVAETGERKFDQSGRDLWITGGPLRFDPGAVGGVRNQLQDAHRLEQRIAARDDVRTAAALSFQTVYVSDDGREFETVVGTGAPAVAGAVQLTEGEGFTRGDPHYADGTYEGPMTREVVVDPRTAVLFDVGINDTLYIGGTLAAARENEFRVVGISPTFSNFLGSPTVVLHLSELQEVTGTTGNDAATIVTIDVAEGASVESVERDLQAQYPEYSVRTNREQLRSTLQRQAVVIASGGSLAVFASLAGAALTVNLLLSYVYQRRRELAALKAVGLSTRTLVGMTVIQAVLLGLAGGLIGAGLTAVSIPLVNGVAGALVGFGSVVALDGTVLLAGVGLAVAISGVAGTIASLRVARLDPLEQLG